MKNKIWIHHLISALFAFALAVCSVGNIITAYGLPVGGMWKIYVWCAFAAIALAVLFQFPHGGKIMAGLAAVAVFVLCMVELLHPFIQTQIEVLSYRITSHYRDVYNWPTLGKMGAGNVTAPLVAWAIFVAFCVNWCICRRKHIAVAILPTVAPLILCLLTADKVPGTGFLYCMVLCLATLLVIDWTRKKQPEQGMKLAIWVVLPVALFLALVFISNPKDTYVNHAGKLQRELSAWFEDVRNAAVSVITGTPASTDKTRNLRTVGERNTSSRALMVVTSPVDGTLYLRERDFDVYTGTTWEASEDRKETFSSGAKTVGTLHILTYSTQSTLLVPYYADTEITLVDGALENKKDVQKYSYGLSTTMSHTTKAPSAQYRKLPDETQAWAKVLAKEITSSGRTTRDKVALIGEYVRLSANYNTTTNRMNDSYDDFAKWFLEESDSGYCVHYATAATVLLRALGVPARYVEGYAIDGVAGQGVVVSKQNAHAWVEYYDWDARAWCVLEVTPTYPELERPPVAPSTGSTNTTDPEEDIPEIVVPEDEPPEEEIPETIPPGGDPSEDVIPDRLPSADDMPEETEPPTEEPPEEQPTEPAPTEPSQPEETEAAGEYRDDSASPVHKTKRWKMPKWLKILLGCLAVIPCIFLLGYLRILRKRKLWNAGTPNGCAIYRWRQTRSMASRLKLRYPRELDALAQKARFSQHEIRLDELQKYADYRAYLVAQVAQKPWLKRMFFKWILAMD